MTIDALIAVLIRARDTLPSKGITQVKVNDGFGLSTFAATIETDETDGVAFVQLDTTVDPDPDFPPPT